MKELHWVAEIERISCPRRAVPHLGAAWINALNTKYYDHGDWAKYENYA